MPSSLSSSTTWLRAKAIRCHAVPAAATVGSASSTRLCIINALLGITATMLATIALGSITTAALPALLVSGAAQSATAAAAIAANRPGLHQHHHSPGNYQGVDAVSALTGLSNGYMPSYYHQLRHAGEHQQQHPQSSPSAGPPNNPTVVDKEPTGRGLQLHASHYGNGVGGGGGGGSASALTSPEALEIFNVPDSGFIPTTLSAAGQHYASSFLGMQSVVDKTNGHVSAALQSPSNAAGKLDLQQSATTTAYAAASNNGPPSLYERLSNYDEESVGVGAAAGVGRSLSSMLMSSGLGDGGGGHSFVPVYDNYAANLYNDPGTNEGEQLQNFANYFTPTTSAMGTAVGVGAGMTTSSSSSSRATTYGGGGGPQSPHKYLPLNNYHNAEQQHVPNQQHYQQMDKQNIYSRAISSATPTSPSPSSSASAATALEFYANYNYPNSNEDNKHLSSYQTWNWDMEKQLADNYYNSQEQQPPASAHQHQLELRQFQQDESEDYKEPETAESSFVLRTREKRGKNKSKRSDPLHDSYDSYSLEGQHLQEHSTTGNDDAETIHVQQQQLEELHQQLHQQQQQFITLQHQLIDHDQQLQIAKAQYQHHPAAGHSLPPVSQTIHHNSHSLHALSGTPLSKHTHVVRSIPVPQRQQVYVPTKQNVNIDVPDPIITTVSKPVPIEVPVSKTIAVPQIKEVKIPIERVKPFPVERPIPYLVEKRVPYTVEKQVAQPVYYHVPIKVPIVHTVVHKLHSPHAYSYQKQQHYQTHPIRYTGHIRHPSHHHHHGGYGGHGHSHYSGGGYYRK